MLKKLLLTLRLGFYSLLLHKLRAALAVLGILIGVTAVIWLVAIGEGISDRAQKDLEDLGARNIIVRSVKPPTESGEAGTFTVRYGLTRDDFRIISAAVPVDILVQAVPMKEFRKEVWYLEGGRSEIVQLVGCTPEYRELNHLEMDRGRFLAQHDIDEIGKVVVIGAEAAERLFPGESPIGRRLLINFDFYTVIGQTKSRTASAAIGGSLDSREYNRDAYIPLTTWDTHIGDVNMNFGAGDRTSEEVERNQFTLTMSDIDHVEDVKDDIIVPVLKRHHRKTDYAVVIPKELLERAKTLRAMFNVLLIVIAGISLLVGGIGIMNIMLATVTERTREIGIRRALGATQGDIVLQFLVESLVLTGVGGALGIALGLACGPVVRLVRWTLTEFFPASVSAIPPHILNIEPILAPWSVGVAFLISVLVGLAFGLYPAYRAATMDPIEALRHE